MFFVYSIYNKEKDKIYTGCTAELEKRIKRHNHLLPNKKTSYTSKNSGFWELVYKEEFETRKQAMKREKELKSSRGRDFIRTIIKNSIRL
ncbi:MAG: GIY-YIG nuclease family protein [bacterium]